MKINGINVSNAAAQITMPQGTDAVTKSLQKQIANAQKLLQELSANKDMGTEEKMQRRKELQQQINDLNNQLRQHQIDLRRQRQQAQKSSKDDKAERSQQKKAEMPGGGMSKAGMEAMVSADTAVKQAKVYGSVAAQLKGEARVLAGEIKLDKDRGLDVGQKEGKLEKIEERIQNATDSQIGTLEEASQELRKAGEQEREDKLENRAEKAADGDKAKEAEKAADGDKAKEAEKAADGDKAKEAEKAGAKDGRFVDVRL